MITGGGPGAMEAANKGACEAGGISVGLGIELPYESGLNEWVDVGINFRYFFARKTMFVKYSQGFIVLPGGVGTLDEMFEALTLVQTKKITSFPIVLVGSAYWSGLLDWMRDTVAGRGHDQRGRPGPPRRHRRRRRGRGADGRPARREVTARDVVLRDPRGARPRRRRRCVAAGRGAPLAEVYDDRPDATRARDGPLGADDLRRVRFSLAFRGYRMSEVDALLDRLARERESRRARRGATDDRRTTRMATTHTR